jgi:hypothetical protein
MRYDIGAYNRDAEAAEAEMLLFNIGQLSNERPPHFMMLQEVDQTRTFSGTGAFQWTHLTDSFLRFFGSTPVTSVTTNGFDSYQTGPFAASVAESPTIKFLPIQGADFFQRVESSQTDKFTFFLEEQRWYATYDEREWLTTLFAQSLELDRGYGGSCPKGLYLNKWPEETQFPRRAFYFDKFSACVHYITHRNDLRYEQLDGSHRISTNTGEAPTAADVVTALQAGYKWVSPSSKSTTNKETIVNERSNTEEKNPSTKRKVTRGRKTTDTGDTTTNSINFTLTNPVRIPAWLSVPLTSEQLDGNEIVSDLWPIPNDYFYLEIRNDALAESACHPQGVGGSDVQGKKNSDVICGYLKIGNLLEIMKRLGKMACSDAETNEERRAACVFGIGRFAPTWADSSASYVYRSRLGINVTRSVWVPAHDPRKDSTRAQRDRYMFLMLYKLYQTSLIDTSKLVTGSTPITISK